MLLAVQAFYMFVSNKPQMKSRRGLYFLAIPLVTAIPLIFNHQDPQSFLVYEYSVVLCMITAGIADSSLAALKDKEYLTDERIRSLHYAYFIICAAVSFSSGISIWVKAVCIILLAGIICRFCLLKKHTWSDVFKAVPLAMFSCICAWAFVKYVL